MRSSSPLISLIVPVYKVEEYLPTCIDSILAQTYENLEIILVDDGSPDSCGEICDSYAKKDARIKVIHKENGGLSSARNAGLAVMSGEYVGFIDSDDSARPEMIEILYENIVKSSADVSICRFASTRTQEGDKDTAVERDCELKVFNREDALKNLLISKYFGGQMWVKLFKREVLDGLYFDESILFIEDIEFSTRALLRANTVCYTPARLYNYFLRDSSLLHSPFAPKHYTAHESNMKIIRALTDAGLYEDLKEYSDAAVVTANMIIMRKLYKSAYKKQYCRKVQKNIRAHLNKKSFSLLARATKIRAAIMAISWRLYFVALKLHL